jgi:hypothetical protein
VGFLEEVLFVLWEMVRSRDREASKGDCTCGTGIGKKMIVDRPAELRHCLCF